MELEVEVQNSNLNDLISESEYPGTTTFIENFQEIQAYRETDMRELSPTQMYHYELEKKKVLKLLEENSNDMGYLPPTGICSEVLFYIALKEKGVYIKPSSLRDDLHSHTDFSVIGYPVDISCVYPNKNYKEKYRYRGVQTVLTPLILSNYRKIFKSVEYFPNEYSYAYDLTRNNCFDVDDYLKETFEINSLVLRIIENPHQKIDNIYGLSSNQFGKVPRKYINTQYTFLRCLRDFFEPPQTTP